MNTECPIRWNDVMKISHTSLRYNNEIIEGYRISEDYVGSYGMRFIPKDITEAAGGLDYKIGTVMIEGIPFVAFVGKGSIPSMMGLSGQIIINGPTILFSPDDTRINGLTDIGDESSEVIQNNIRIIRLELDDCQRKLIPCVAIDNTVSGVEFYE